MTRDGKHRKEDIQHNTSTPDVPIRSSLSLSNVINLRAWDDMKVEPRWVRIHQQLYHAQSF